MTLPPAFATEASCPEDQSKPATVPASNQANRFDLLFKLNEEEMAGRLIGHQLVLDSIK